MRSPTNILGLCIGEFASAALLIDGRLVGASYEERFHRKKCYSGFPYKSIDFLLRTHGLSPQDIHCVRVMNETACGLEYALIQRLHSFEVSDFIREAYDYFYPVLFKQEKVRYLDVFKDKIDQTIFPKEVTHILLREGETADNSQRLRRHLIHDALGTEAIHIEFIEHHLSHAVYGALFAPTGVKSAQIYTADSFGDYSNANVFNFGLNKTTTLHSSAVQNLGRLFRNLTLLLGMKPYQHEYKVMGLAPYASASHATKIKAVLESYMSGFQNGEWVFRKKPTDHYFTFRDHFEGVRFDTIAGGLQLYFEEQLLGWFRAFLDNVSSQEPVIFSGGLSMNVKANMRLTTLAEEFGRPFYAAPSGDDYSHCISVAYVDESLRRGDSFQSKFAQLDRLDLGYRFSASDESNVCEWARSNGWSIQRRDNTKVAKALSEGRILALCYGNAEFGARALGFRSIIADPRTADTIRRINIAIKKRDFWMPFAPAILQGHEDKYLHITTPNAYRFMACAAQTTPLGRQMLQAAIHPYDGTARPQIVDIATNPIFAGILERFGEQTGTYALLNTSLNLHGYPIVNDGGDLIHVLQKSDLDGAVLPDHLLLRREAKP